MDKEIKEYIALRLSEKSKENEVFTPREIAEIAWGAYKELMDSKLQEILMSCDTDTTGMTIH